MKHINIVWICFFALISCSKKNDLTTIFGAIQDIHCEEVEVDGFLGDPREINAIDNYLVFFDRIDDQLAAIYDINEKKIIHRIFTKGQGPDELRMPLGININTQNKLINVLQRQNGIYTQYKLSELLKGNIKPANKLNFGNVVDGVVETNTGFIAAGFYDNGIIGLYDHDGNLKNVVDIYPDYFSKINDIESKYRLGQGELHYNQDTKTFVFGAAFTGEISFFSLSNTQELSLINSYSLDKSSSLKNRVETNADNIPILETDIYHCLDICSSKEYVYILYCGENIENRKLAKYSYILKFSSTGKAIAGFKTDCVLYGICYNHSGKIYGISLSKDLDPIFVSLNI